MKKLIIILVSLVLVSSYCYEAPNITAENAVIRKPPAGTNITAAFFTLKNGTHEELAIAEIKSDVAATVEIHETYQEKGMAKMRKVESIPVPAGGEAVLKPGSYHVMLIDLKRELKTGETLPLIVKFSSGALFRISAKVQEIEAAHH